jgi:hypothetical protein
MDYESILFNWVNKLWGATAVRLAVRKGVITQEECDVILATPRN